MSAIICFPFSYIKDTKPLLKFGFLLKNCLQKNLQKLNRKDKITNISIIFTLALK